MNDDILARYEKAHQLMQGILTNRIAVNDAVFPHWIQDTNYFWYKREKLDGKEYRLVDAKAASNVPAFDHPALAGALTKASGKAAPDRDLPIKVVSITMSPLQVHFRAFNKRWLFEAENTQCQETEVVDIEGLKSPDGKKVVFVRDYNVWIRDQETGKEQALTTDGTADNCYASSPNPYTYTAGTVQALWSPNSKYLFTCQLDRRQVATRTLVHYAPEDGSMHPQLTQFKSAYPGDKNVESYRLLVIDVDTTQVVPADYEPLTPWGMGEGFFSDEHLGWWSSNSQHAFFVDVARGAKSVRVIVFDTFTGATRTLFQETSKTFVKLSHTSMVKPLFLPLPESDELIWFSERTGWGHLYLYDLKTGEQKNPITGGRLSAQQGEWLVRGLLYYDAEQRELFIQTAARDQSISPHYRDICRVNIDSGDLNPLVSGNFEYLVYRPDSIPVMVLNGFGLESSDIDGVSPNGEYFVTTRSRVDTVPVSILVDRNGNEILKIETADVSNLPVDWQWPEPIKVRSADNVTDIYGVIYRPPGFCPNRQYPVLDFSCYLRSFSYIPQGSFVNGPCYDFYYLLGAALATLGFIVVALECRGAPNRSKAFQDYNHDGHSGSDFADRIAGLQQIAIRYPYMDLERVGISGVDNLSAPVYALLKHSDFYKVSVLHGFLEPRCMPATFGEQHEGIPTDGSEKPQIQYAEDCADSFDGKLLMSLTN